MLKTDQAEALQQKETEVDKWKSKANSTQTKLAQQLDENNELRSAVSVRDQVRETNSGLDTT